MPAIVDPLEALKGLQIITILYVIVTFGITIYQVFLNKRQAKVHEQMGLLIDEAKEIKELMKSWKK